MTAWESTAKVQKIFHITKKYLAIISNNLQQLASPILNLLPLHRQKESKAVRRLEANGDENKLINNLLSTY